jgi:hypothetical protein
MCSRYSFLFSIKIFFLEERKIKYKEDGVVVFSDDIGAGGGDCGCGVDGGADGQQSQQQQ